MAVITMSRADMLAAIGRGESVSLPPSSLYPVGAIITRTDQVPSQAMLDAGSFDPAPGATSAAGIAGSGGTLGTNFPTPNWVTGDYNLSTAALGAGNMSAFPLAIPRSCLLTDMAAEVTVAAASSFVRMGLYRDNGNGYPGALVTGTDTGQIDASTTGVKTFTFASPIALSPGLYWVAGVNQGGAPTVRIQSGVSPGIAASTATLAIQGQLAGYFQSGVTAALPSTFSASLVATASAHRVALRLQ